MPLEAGQSLLHYRLIEKIGEGGMGVVWKARDSRLDREVAVKLLPEGFADRPERLARFEREARALAALNHPGIVTIHAVERAGHLPFLVMECVTGAPLNELIPDGGLEAGRLFELAVALVEAVEAAHEHGVTHRDLKPGNVIVTGAGRVKVLDFGLAKLVQDDSTPPDPQATSTQATAVGTIVGTAAYMSPEQAEGRTVDARSDIFSLGVLLFEMAAGRRPFEGTSAAQIVSAILRDDPPPLASLRPDLPRELGHVVDRCLAKQPQQRFQAASDLRRRLQELRDAARVEQAVAGGAGRSRRPGLWVGVAALVLVAAAAWLWLGRGRSGQALPAPGGDSPSPFAARRLSQLTFGEELEQWPAWSPDGGRLVYSADVDGFSNLFLRELDSGETRRLTQGRQDDIQPAWSPDGKKIVFVRGSGKLEPADVQSREYLGADVWLLDVDSGEATPLLKDAANPDFSPDGSRLAVDADWTGPRRIWTTDEFGRNPRQITTDASEAIGHMTPVWSPDGRHLAFQQEWKARRDIRVVDVATGETTPVTDDLYRDLDPVWWGGQIYFSSYRGGGMNIWRVAVDPATGRPSGPPEQLTTGAGMDLQATLSPDGTRLGFTVLSENADLWRLPLDPATGAVAGEPQPLIVSSREDSRGAFSTDGRLAFNSDRDGEMNLWLYRFADGSTRPLTRGPGGDYQPNWSPDNRSIVFFSARAGNADIWVVEVDSGELRQITDHPSLDTNPFFSPDGKTIAFQSDREGRKEVWLVDADGANARPLSKVGVSDHFMRWSDDGRYVYFRSTALTDNSVCRIAVADGTLEPLGLPVGWHMSFSPDRSLLLDAIGHKALWIYSLAGGEPRAIFGFEDPEIRIDYPEWSPDGRWVVFDRVAPKGGDVWLLEGL